jgi:hypothetical protein
MAQNDTYGEAMKYSAITLVIIGLILGAGALVGAFWQARALELEGSHASDGAGSAGVD